MMIILKQIFDKKKNYLGINIYLKVVKVCTNKILKIMKI